MSLNEKSDMAANSRGGLHPSRHSSRTPPFILVGLLVVIAILGFNYWTTSAANRELDETLKTLNAKYTSTNNKLSSQGLELKSVRDENAKHRARVEDLESDLGLKTNEHGEIKIQLEESQQSIQKLHQEYADLRQEIEQQENAHGIELDECENDKEILENDLKTKEISLTECAAEKSALTDSQRQLQTQVDDLQNQFNQRTCSGEVSAYRIKLLTTLQDLGGPDVLRGLQRVGIDISGVELNQNWVPPPGSRQEGTITDQQPANVNQGDQAPVQTGNEAQPLDNQQPSDNQLPPEVDDGNQAAPAENQLPVSDNAEQPAQDENQFAVGDNEAEQPIENQFGAEENNDVNQQVIAPENQEEMQEGEAPVDGQVEQNVEEVNVDEEQQNEEGEEGEDEMSENAYEEDEEDEEDEDALEGDEEDPDMDDALGPNDGMEYDDDQGEDLRFQRADDLQQEEDELDGQ